MVNAPNSRTNLIMAMRAGAMPTSQIPSNDVAAQTMWRRSYQSSRDRAHSQGFPNARAYLMNQVSQNALTQSPYITQGQTPPKSMDPRIWLLMKYLMAQNNIPGVFYGR